MHRAEQVKLQLQLLEQILTPGQIIQVQDEIPGAGDQIQVELEQITNASFEWNGEADSFNRYVFYQTLSGKTIGYDLGVGNWWLVIKRPGQANVTSPVCVFTI